MAETEGHAPILQTEEEQTALYFLLERDLVANSPLEAEMDLSGNLPEEDKQRTNALRRIFLRLAERLGRYAAIDEFQWMLMGFWEKVSPSTLDEHCGPGLQVGPSATPKSYHAALWARKQQAG